MPRPPLLTNTRSNAALVHATHPCSHMGRYYTDRNGATVCARCNAKLTNRKWSA